MINLSQRSTEHKMKLVYAALNTSAVLAWRFPTTEEQLAYVTAKYRKEEDCQLKFGLIVLTGIRDGDFGTDGKPLSSTPGAEGYQENWKDALKENSIASKMISDMAALIFDGAYSVPIGEDEALPFAKS